MIDNEEQTFFKMSAFSTLYNFDFDLAKIKNGFEYLQKGYNNIKEIKKIHRKFIFDDSSLQITNIIEGEGNHFIEAILNVASNLDIAILKNQIKFIFRGKNICLLVVTEKWNIIVEESFYSPFYMEKIKSRRIVISKKDFIPTELNFKFQF